MFNIPMLPIAEWVEKFTDWLTISWAPFFNALQSFGQSSMDGMTAILNFIPAIVWIIGLTIAAYFVSKKKIGFTLFTLIGLVFVYNQQLWPELMSTVTLVLVSGLLSVVIGVPLGIWMAKSNKVQTILAPILDFMQTMPGFVYLIPAVAFFGIGIVPGVFASIIFALPPTIRFTNLGIRQVPNELVEASDSFGSTASQKLFKLELPLAKSTIMAGINQTIMLALSMVVIASMIGAPGLGRGVLSALQRAQVGNGFVNGMALVVLAIILDRFIQYINQPKDHAATKTKTKRQKYLKWGSILGVILIAAGATFFAKGNEDKNTVNLAYVEWDSEVASTNVIAEVLRQGGMDVKMTPLDNSIMWKSISQKEADATVSAWLPNTHAAQYKQYKNDIVDLGANLDGAKVGIVVPKYMNIKSIDQLTDQADKQITGIEPGAGIMTAADKVLKEYPNLKDWQLKSSSSGAMTVALGKAIKNKEPIVITGWSPHWMFAKYDLNYLEDPKNAMGSAEQIHTITRKGLASDSPKANKILKNFKWTTKDLESVMLDINKGTSPEQAAKTWVKNNQSKVDAWIK